MEGCLDLQNMEICKDWNVEDYLKTNERGKIPFLIRKHLNECQKCQAEILEYSKSYTIPDFLFGRPFSKQKLLWFGAELENFDDLHSTKEQKKGPLKDGKFRGRIPYLKLNSESHSVSHVLPSSQKSHFHIRLSCLADTYATTCISDFLEDVYDKAYSTLRTK